VIMNKIFRVIWSHAQQAWVVVSELVKSYTKTSTYTDKRAQVCTSDYFLDKQQDKFKLSLLSLVLLSIFFSPVGLAVFIQDGSTNVAPFYDNGAIGIGYRSYVGNSGVVIGKHAVARDTVAVAIGYSAEVVGHDGVAVGAHAQARYRSVASGYSAKALGQRSVAIGDSAEVNSGATRAIALGHNSIVTVAGGVALGYGSRAETKGGIEGAKQTHSVVTDEKSEANGFKSTEKVSNNAIGAVSVGNDNIKRQIINVAAGKEDTDAVNVAQLKSLTMKIAGDTGNSDNEKVGIWNGTLKVLGTSGEISTSASNDTITLKLDDMLKKKITDSASKEYVDNVFKNVKVTGGGQEFTVGNGDTSTQKITVNTDAGKKHFDIKGKDGVTTTVVGRAVEVGLTTETKNKINKIDNLETKVNNQGITFKGNTGQTNSIKLGDTLKVEGVTGETEVMASTDKLALGLAKKVKDEIASKMSSFKIKANSEANEETISNDNTIVFKNGKNINVTRSNKELIFATVATPEFTSVQYGNSGPKITSTGGNLKVTGADGNTPVKIANVAEGTEINDAVNKGQLDNATVTYFHTNTGEQSQGEGDENTNKGKITDKAGARGKHSVTAGVNAKAEGENSIAIGYEAKISAQNAVAIGANSKAGSHSAAYGYNAQALGERSVAVGENAMINDRAARATAIGHNSIVSVGGGVALGYGSNADRAGDIEGAKQSYSVTVASSVDNGFKSTGSVDNNSIPIGAVSVGNVRIKRQIVNVAAGTQDTDAVNVAQLKSLTMKIEGNENKHNGANADLNSADRPKVGLWSDTLKVLGTDGEIKTSASGNTITLKLDETLKNKITNLDSKVTKLDKDGLMVKTSTAPDAKTIEVSKDGIKAGDKKITNVAEGTISGTSTDAVTGKQLHNFITANNNVVNNSGSVNFADGNHTKIDTQTTGTIKVNVTTGAFVNPTTDGKLSQQTAGVATIENVSAAVNAGYWTAKVNGNTEVAKIKFGDTLDFVDGNVTTARMSEAGKVTFDVKVDDSSIKIVNGKLVSTLKAPETTTLTVSEANDNTKGKVTDVAEGDKNKFVTADNIATTLNKIGFNVESGGNLATGNADGKQLIKAGDTVTFKAGYGLTVKREGNNFTYALGSTLTTDKFTAGEKGENGKEGKDGTIGVNGKDGSSVVINGKDGSIGLNGTNGENGVTIKGGQGSAGVDGADGTTKTRIVYEYKDPNTNEMVTEKIATLNDGQKYSGDNYAENKAETVIKKKLNERLEIKGGATEVSTNNNIGVIAENGVLNVRLAKNIDLGADGSVTTGNTKVDNNGITIKKPANAGDGKSDVKLTANGLDNGGNKIINVAAGVADTDAVNVKQLKSAKTEVE
ncbi:ESPR-type extended signal peptide-containing protein, partial [Glaesserella parasuis]|nr:ESPR-type extended signal peptide-containing protein [Glaesserella parasuis]